jgi:hypothetical protein
MNSYESNNGTIIYVAGGGVFMQAFYTIVDRRMHQDYGWREGKIGSRIVWEDTEFQQEEA